MHDVEQRDQEIEPGRDRKQREVSASSAENNPVAAIKLQIAISSISASRSAGSQRPLRRAASFNPAIEAAMPARPPVGHSQSHWHDIIFRTLVNLTLKLRR
ncbi:MAG: hypothetical protein HKN78_10065 [Sphingomonadaceae bacterium]|nr:hypothetical protein [Sphingomonadaceae bacterium]